MERKLPNIFVHLSRIASNNLRLTNNTTSQYRRYFELQNCTLRIGTKCERFCEPLKQRYGRRQTHSSCQQELCESSCMFALRIVLLYHLLPLLGTVLNEEFGSFSDVALLRLGAFAAFRLESVQQDLCSNRRKLSMLDLDPVSQQGSQSLLRESGWPREV